MLYCLHLAPLCQLCAKAQSGGVKSLLESLVVPFGVFERESLADERDSSVALRAPSE